MKQLKVVVIKTDGSFAEIVINDTLRAMQALVGGRIENVDLTSGAHMYVNEEGARLCLPVNRYANSLVSDHEKYEYRLGAGGILGDVFVLGDVDDTEGDSTDVPGWVLNYMKNLQNALEN